MSNDVPQVDLNTPLPVDQEVVVDSVMIKARKEWIAGIVLFALFLMSVSTVGYFYHNQTNRQSENSESQITQTVREPERSLAPVSSVKPVIVVWNGSGVAGAAGKMAEKLKEAGYQMGETRNAPKTQVGTSVAIAKELVESDQVEKILSLVGVEKYEVMTEANLEYNVLIIIGK